MQLMQGKVCLITGATSGIGKVTANELAKRKATIILVSSNQQRGESTRLSLQEKNQNQNVDFIQCDLTSQSSIRQLVKQVKSKYNRLDILINNAGAIFKEKRLTEEGVEQTFALNHLAPFLLTNLLLDLLKVSAPARIINVTSNGHALNLLDLDNVNAQKSFNGPLHYCQAKLANILFTYDLATKLEGTGVTVNCLHPGTVKTNFGQHASFFYKYIVNSMIKPFMIPPEEGAKTSIYLATSPDVSNITGKYFVKEKPVKSSSKTYDTKLAKQLWELSAKLTKLA